MEHAIKPYLSVQSYPGIYFAVWKWLIVNKCWDLSKKIRGSCKKVCLKVTLSMLHKVSTQGLWAQRMEIKAIGIRF